MLLHQWDTEWDTERALKDFPGVNDEIGLQEKTDILCQVAAYMQTSPSGLSGNLIDKDALTSLIEEYLCDELRFDQARAIARALVKQLRERNFILCFVGADSYAFVHRTFLEYFCAADIVHQFNIAKTLDQKGLVNLFDEHCCDSDWREVLRLICSQIDAQFVGEIIGHLATRTNLDEWDGKMPLPELLLAVYCLGEARNLSRLERQGEALLRQLIQVFKGTTNNLNFRYESKVVAMLYRFFDQIIEVSHEIGMRWPGRGNIEAME